MLLTNKYTTINKKIINIKNKKQENPIKTVFNEVPKNTKKLKPGPLVIEGAVQTVEITALYFVLQRTMSALTAIFTSQYDRLSSIIAENVHAMCLAEVHRELNPALDKLWLHSKKMTELQDLFQLYASQNRIVVTRILHNTSVTHHITISLPDYDDPANPEYDTIYQLEPFTLAFDWDFLEWQRKNPIESCPFEELRLFYGRYREVDGAGAHQRVIVPLMVSKLPEQYPFNEFTDKKIFHSFTPGFVGLEVSLPLSHVNDINLSQ